MDSSTISSLDKDYDDGVYDKANPPSKHAARAKSEPPADKPSKLPVLMLACLVSLLVFCFIGTLVSGLYFNNRNNLSVTTPVASSDCLGPSWTMFSVCSNVYPPSPACFWPFHSAMNQFICSSLTKTQPTPLEVHPWVPVPRPAPASRAQGGAHQPHAAAFAASPSFRHRRRRPPRYHRLDGLAHHCLRCHR